jgi:myo-inositol-1(or 4)-monophosphatase
MTDLAHLLAVAHDAADIARDIVRNSSPGVVIAKGDRDPASEVDYEVERTIRKLLHDRTPHIGFLGEEEGTTGPDSEYTWVLDPVDGTVNFVHGHPLVAVSLGLLRERTPELGVIDLPLLGERYSAAVGGGAFGPTGQLAVTQPTRLEHAVISIGDYAVGEQAPAKNELRLAITSQLAARALRVRMHGSAAIDLAWLAAGRTDASLIMANNPWDMTAGVVLAREAGAVVFDVDESPYDADSSATIAVSPSLRDHVLSVLRYACRC